MRQLLPDPIDDVDLWDVYRPADFAQPWLRLDMVTSADGSVTDPEGHSGGLGGDGDWQVFRTLRAQAHAVLVGAGTARHESYGPAKLHRDVVAPRRRDLGLTEPPVIVLVSVSLDLDPHAAIFTEARVPTTVLTCAASDPWRRAALEKASPVIVAGDTAVDLGAGLAAVREQHGPVVVCEGGPTLNAALLSEGLVDELCLSVTPQLVGGSSPRLSGGFHGAAELALASACTDGSGELYLRYTHKG